MSAGGTETQASLFDTALCRCPVFCAALVLCDPHWMCGLGCTTHKFLICLEMAWTWGKPMMLCQPVCTAAAASPSAECACRPPDFVWPTFADCQTAVAFMPRQPKKHRAQGRRVLQTAAGI